MFLLDYNKYLYIYILLFPPLFLFEELGLKVAAMPTATYSFWTQDLHTELEAVDQLLLEEESDEEEEPELVEEVEEEWTAADSSHSDIVKRMNEVDGLWEAWQPTDTMGIAIKRSID